MKGIRLLIDTQNAAFAEYPEMELARIFRVLSDRLEHGEIPEKLLDINGNTVGFIHIEEAAADKVPSFGKEVYLEGYDDD